MRQQTLAVAFHPLQPHPVSGRCQRSYIPPPSPPPPSPQTTHPLAVIFLARARVYGHVGVYPSTMPFLLFFLNTLYRDHSNIATVTDFFLLYILCCSGVARWVAIALNTRAVCCHLPEQREGQLCSPTPAVRCCNGDQAR